MSYESVKAYFEEAGLSGRITEREQTGDTVEHAAQVIGCARPRLQRPCLSWWTAGR